MDLNSMKEKFVLDYTMPVIEAPAPELIFNIKNLEDITFKDENKEYTINFKKFLKDYGVENNE